MDKGKSSLYRALSGNALLITKKPLQIDIQKVDGHVKSVNISGFLAAKGKERHYVLNDGKLAWFTKIGDKHPKGGLATCNITKIDFVIEERGSKSVLILTVKDKENGKAYDHSLEIEDLDKARIWWDAFNWSKSNVFANTVPTNLSLHPMESFNGCLKKKTVNGYKARYFCLFGNKLKWYANSSVTEEVLGILNFSSILGVYDASVEGKVNPAFADTGIPNSKLECAFFIDRNTIDHPLCLIAGSKEIKEVWIYVLKRTHSYLCKNWDKLDYDDLSDMDNDDAEEEFLMSKSRLSALVSFVPEIVARRYIEDPSPPIKPVEETFTNAAVLFADISGFTPLAESLAKFGGGEGAEILSNHLNNYFGKLVEIIHEHGGDVIKYAGDALLALWSSGTINSTTYSATQCAFKIQTHTAQYSADSVTLTLHIGISAGTITGLHVGGVNDRWEYLIRGEPMIDIALAEGAAKSGEVVLTDAAWKLVSEKFSAKKVPNAQLWKLESPSNTSAADLLTLTQPALHRDDAPISIYPALLSYIPISIKKKIDLGLAHWMAELRRVTVLFVQLLDLEENIKSLQKTFCIMQTRIYEFDGIIRQFIIDDKGSVLVAAFYQHEDDPVRGLKASIEIVTDLKKIKVRACVGVTTGMVYMGAVGSPNRREFAMVGDTVNLSARLMGLANTGVLCDNYTYQTASEYPNTELKFASLNSIPIKGKSKLIPIFSVNREFSVTPTPQRMSNSRSEPVVVIGREEETKHLSFAIKKSQRGLRTFVIEGEEGTGKSLILELLKKQIYSMNGKRLPILFEVFGESIQNFNNLFGWRRCLIHQVLNCKITNEIERSRKEITYQILRYLNKIPEWIDYAALLNDVLDTNIPKTDCVKNLDAGAKIAKTISLIANMISTKARQRRLIIIIDDGQWLDSASYEVLLKLRDLCPSILIIIACHLTMTMPIDFNYLVEVSICEKIKLGSLSLENTGKVACNALKVVALPDNLTELIHKKASGNPYFSQLLALSLKENNILTFGSNGTCSLSSDVKEISDIPFPDSLENFVISRIDRLNSKSQFVIKVASVIGMQFAFRTLAMIYPIPDDKGSIKECMEQLKQLELIAEVPFAPEPTYRFSQSVVQQCCYNLLLFQQRRTLHKAIATWYIEYVNDLKSHHPRLGFHFETSEMYGDAAYHYEEAGNESGLQSAARESIIFYEKAIVCLDKHMETLNADDTRHLSLGEISLRYSRIQNGIGISYFHLGLFKSALPSFESAVKYAGQKDLNSTRLGDLGKGLKALAKKKQLNTEKRLLEAEAIRAYENMANIHFLLGDEARMQHNCLAFVNLATACNMQPELARAYSSLAIALKISGDEQSSNKQYQKGLELCEPLPHLLTFADVIFTSSLWEMMNGQLSINALDNVLDMYERSCLWMKWSQAALLLSNQYHVSGEFESCLRIGGQIIECGSKVEDNRALLDGYIMLARTFMNLKDLDNAYEAISEAEKIIDSDLGKELLTSSLWTEIFGYLSIINIYNENFDLGIVHLNKVMSQNELPLSNYHLYFVYYDLIDVCVRMKHTAQAEGSRDLYQEYIQKLTIHLGLMAKVFPLVAPRALLRHGQMDHAQGHFKKSKKCFDEALTSFDGMNLRYDKALVMLEIGSLEKNQTLVEKGLEAFEQLNFKPPELYSSMTSENTTENSGSPRIKKFWKEKKEFKK